jgi:hypothetical protein
MSCLPTIINRPGSRGAPGVTYTICCSKTYAQTLFLGCSVKSFNCSLGWGGEASRLSVELAYDSCAYPVLKDINGNPVPRPNGSDEYTRSLLNNDFNKDENGNNLVPGKVYYRPEGDKVVSKYFYGPDPGFYADMPNPLDSVDIIGCPVYFKYNDFEFSGIVKNWENTGNSGGTQTYTVSIESPSFLLSQTQMILGDYTGAIFVKSNSFPPFGFSKFAYGDYRGKIAEQNIPNVINVYGYLEDVTNINSNQPLDSSGVPEYRFGASGRNDEGLLAIPIIAAAQDLLNSPLPYTKQKIMRYSPFGRIVGITPKYKTSALDINNTYIMGLVQPQPDPVGLNRIMYTIDITQINNDNAIPPYYRINENYMSILDFVSNICDSTGKELYITLDFQIVDGAMFPRIVVNTITRLNQPPDGAVQSYVDYLSGLGISVASYAKGEEYNNTRPVRSMYIGGKQQRLYQVRNTKYAISQWVLRYNAHKNMFTQVSHSLPQDYRLPNVSSLRNPAHYGQNTPATAFGRVELPSDFNQVDSAPLTRKNINRGNYLPEKNVGAIGSIPDSMWYPSSDSDSICPYFGTNDITGVVRKVYNHRTGFIVEFTTSEIGLAISRTPAFNDTVGVSESEIRAAMAGLDEYVGFMSAVVDDAAFMGGPAGADSALQTWGKVLSPLLGLGALRSMAQGIAQTSNKVNNSQSGSSSVPINPRTSFMTDNPIFNIVVKLQEYLKKIGDEYYGRKFMVSIPTPDFWRDSRVFSPPIQIGSNFDGSPILLTEGTNKVYYAYEPADFAWEEAGNMIDDSLLVGNAAMDLFTKEDGTIEPIIGYINNAQYNYSKEFNKALWDGTRNNGTNNFFQFWKYEAYRNAGIVYGNTAATNFWEPLLKFPGTEQYTIARNAPATDPFGTTIPAQYSYKTYLKAKVEKELQTYVTSMGSVVAKVIITTDPVQINPINPQALSIRTLAVEYLANNYGGVLGFRAAKILSLADNFVQANNNTFNVNNVLSQNKDNQQYTNMAAVPKMAVPAFAAIPLVFNNCVYGPWISAPDLVMNNIFGGQKNPLNRLENLVGGVKLEINNDLVPWNYGGMRILDEAALLMTGQDNDYQTKSETGQLTVYGTPELNLGDELKAVAFAFRGPTVNNVQVQISENGPTTTYTFRTFTRKFTLFNKESADRLKSAGQSSIKMSRELRQQARNTTEKLRGLSTTAAFSSYDFTGSKLTAYSPMSVLVGFSSPYVSPKTQLNPGFYQPNKYSGDSIKQLTTVSLQDTRELTQEFDHLYASKSFMSLDGLLSPVSFYPTLNNSTTPYKRYAKAGCPMCGGTKQYTVANKQLYCDFCTEDPAGTEEAQNNTGGGGKLPPFILSNQADERILQDPNKLSTLLTQVFITKRINYVNLNPIIMPVGELRNKYAQQNDFNAHHIDIVGRSSVPMLGSLSITDNLAINQGGLEFLDQNNDLSDVDWNAYAFDQEAGLQPKLLQSNHRFLGLRGPLVMAGWGFDTEGYPVPNASGEPKQLDNEGYPKRIQSLEDLQGGFQNYPGTILGKNQEIRDGKWTKPKKENEFMKGWGLRPDSWPVGPVDLRWDESRKVWTAASDHYRLVDVQLEDNLLSPFPARGYLHAVDKNDPLPSGLRRMVFVKDSSNIYGAPRGAKLLCYYDQSTGFYEPVSKQNIMATGYIQSNGTAIVYNSYAKGYDEYTGEPVTPEPLQIEFNNFLNFPLTTNNQPGMFVFMNNEWVLMSTHSCGN